MNYADCPSFMKWYTQVYNPEAKLPKPRWHEVVYFEHCASGIGIQIDKDCFEEYLKLFRDVDGFSYMYDRTNDCTVYCIDGNPVLRYYYWRCIEND